MSEENTDLFNLQLTPGGTKPVMKAVGASSSDLWKVKREHIHVIDGFNVRNPNDPAYKAHVKSLAQSIEENGYMADKPLAGYVAREESGDVIYLTDGHSRLAAVDLLIAKGIEFEGLPVVVKERGTSMEDLTIALVTSNSGKPLTPMELVTVIKRLKGFGMDDKTIAKRLTITKKYLDDLLFLAAAPTAIRDMVSNGKVSASLAISTLRDNPKKAVEKLQAAVVKVEASGKTKVTPKNMKAPKAEKHIDDILVDKLAAAMKARLAQKRDEGKSGWQEVDIQVLHDGIDATVHNSTPEARIDHINYLAMLNWRLNNPATADGAEQQAAEVPPADDL